MAELRVKSTGTLKLFESDNTSSVTIASPASLGGDRTITLPDASVTLASGTMLATDGSGASLTALNASEIGSGTVPTARLGSGTASSSTVLYGDQTYKAEPSGGLVKQVVQFTEGVDYTSTATPYVQGPETGTFTMTDTSNKILVTASICAKGTQAAGGICSFLGKIYRGDIATGTALTGGSYPMWYINDAGTEAYIITSIQYLDTPGDNTTYSIGYKFHNADGAGIFGTYYNTNIIMQEIEV